jgi:hypothetical protein
VTVELHKLVLTVCTGVFGTTYLFGGIPMLIGFFMMWAEGQRAISV